MKHTLMRCKYSLQSPLTICATRYSGVIAMHVQVEVQMPSLQDNNIIQFLAKYGITIVVQTPLPDKAADEPLAENVAEPHNISGPVPAPAAAQQPQQQADTSGATADALSQGAAAEEANSQAPRAVAAQRGTASVSFNAAGASPAGEASTAEVSTRGAAHGADPSAPGPPPPTAKPAGEETSTARRRSTAASTSRSEPKKPPRRMVSSDVAAPDYRPEEVAMWSRCRKCGHSSSPPQNRAFA